MSKYSLGCMSKILTLLPLILVQFDQLKDHEAVKKKKKIIMYPSLDEDTKTVITCIMDF